MLSLDLHGRQPAGEATGAEDALFELIVFGAGGGPLETDLSGYMLKPRNAPFEDGWIALEGGCGIGALASILATPRSETSLNTPSAAARQVCGDVVFPEELLSTEDEEVRAIYKAGYLFGFLSAYIITHAHLDHISAMILSTGSMPAAHRSRKQSSPITTSDDPNGDKRKRKRSVSPESATPAIDSAAPTWGTSFNTPLAVPNGDLPPAPSVPPPMFSRAASTRRPSSVTGAGTCRETLVPIYASQPVLECLEGAYQGDLWPELGHWASGLPVRMSGKGDEAVDAYALEDGVGVQLCLLSEPGAYQRLPGTADEDRPAAKYRMSIAHFPVSHGCTSHGTYESTAFFIRLEDARPDATKTSRPREILFWGDVESQRGTANGDGNAGRCKERQQTERVWAVAADRFEQGRLAAIFIECSYDSSRPADKLYGHLQPSSLWAELNVLAEFVRSKRKRYASGPPLQDLRVYITHVKQSLVPHPSGLTDRERIERSLLELEERAEKSGTHLGVKWIMVRKGQAIIV